MAQLTAFANIGQRRSLQRRLLLPVIAINRHRKFSAVERSFDFFARRDRLFGVEHPHVKDRRLLFGGQIEAAFVIGHVIDFVSGTARVDDDSPQQREEK